MCVYVCVCVFVCVWGYMLKNIRVGSRQVGAVFTFFIIIYFSMQRTYGTLKQNLIKFKYFQVINLN